MIHRALVTALVMCAFACVTQAQRTIRISVDPSLKVPLVAIAGEFKKVHKDVKVEFVSAAKATVVAVWRSRS